MQIVFLALLIVFYVFLWRCYQLGYFQTGITFVLKAVGLYGEMREKEVYTSEEKIVSVSSGDNHIQVRYAPNFEESMEALISEVDDYSIIRKK